MAKHAKRNQGMGRKKKIAISIVSVVLILVGAAVAYGYSILSKINHQNIGRGSKDAGEIEAQGVDKFVPVDEKRQKDKDILNIALFGMDRRKNEPCRSDTMMVVSINRRDKTVKLTSLMRDMYVKIPGHESKPPSSAGRGLRSIR